MVTPFQLFLVVLGFGCGASGVYLASELSTVIVRLRGGNSARHAVETGSDAGRRPQAEPFPRLVSFQQKASKGFEAQRSFKKGA